MRSFRDARAHVRSCERSQLRGVTQCTVRCSTSARHSQTRARQSAVHNTLTPRLLRAADTSPLAARAGLEQLEQSCRSQGLGQHEEATTRSRRRAAAMCGRVAAAAHASRVAVAVAAVAAHQRRTAIAERMTRGGVWQSTRVGGVGREGGQEGRAGWAGPCESARAVGGVLLLLRVLRHRRWAASSTVAYAVDALCARARARECASVLRQACVCPRLAAMFKTKCARERRVAEYVFVTDCRVITSPLFTFLLGANPSASTLR